jgi:hypothetical protein
MMDFLWEYVRSDDRNDPRATRKKSKGGRIGQRARQTA